MSINIKNYTLKTSDERYFIKDLTLDIKNGEILGIAGNSGVGKTILALAIAGITNSSFISDGEIIRNYNKQKVSILFQNPISQIFSTKVYDEIKNSLHLNNKDISHENILKLSKLWNIDDVLDKSVDKLSLGEAQKVAITSIMISSPDLIILDEPFQYVDNSKFRDNLMDIKKINPNIMIIIIEHNYYMLNLISDKILLLEEDNHKILKTIESPKIEPIFLKTKKELSTITFNQVYFSYSKNAVLSNFSYKLEHNFLIIDGKNGSGKSTLVKLLVRLLIQKKGDIYCSINDNLMKNPKLKNIREYIGYVFQNPDYQIFANTVKEEIYYGENNTINESRDLYIDYWLKRFNLSDFLDKSPHTLSYGERRRLNFLSATIKLPQIIIYDEPTVGLDYENRKVLLEFMKYHNDNGKTQILISHDRWFKEHIQGDFERIKL